MTMQVPRNPKTSDQHRARSRAYYWANHDAILAKRKEHRKTCPQPETSRQRYARSQRWFTGNDQAALLRDEYRCIMCGATENLLVHHLDGQCRGTDSPNHALENLATLCRGCHQRVHRPRHGTGRPNRLIPCACGCGRMLWEYDSSSHRRKYAHGQHGVRHSAETRAQISQSLKAAWARRKMQ